MGGSRIGSPRGGGVRAPIVGITTDVIDRNGRDTSIVAVAYANAVAAAGGLPVLLTPLVEMTGAYVEMIDALVLTGGDDPRMEPFGGVTHPKATPLHPLRQAFESGLIVRVSAERPELPVLGVCLGMQMLALHAGGAMDQYMPERRADASRHWEGEHGVEPTGEAVAAGLSVGRGLVRSRHKQAVIDPGSMCVVAMSDDGVIEAIADPQRPFVLGVQWHPERTEDPVLGVELFRRLVGAVRARE